MISLALVAGNYAITPLRIAFGPHATLHAIVQQPLYGDDDLICFLRTTLITLRD